MNFIVMICYSKTIARVAFVLALAAAVRATAADATATADGKTVVTVSAAPNPALERAHDIRIEGIVNGPIEDVWRVFTTSEGAQEFFAPKANIQLTIGGLYEIFFDPKVPAKSTRGLKILSYAPAEMITFQWSAPPNLPEVRNGGTWVVVQLHRESATTTRVSLSHLGWKAAWAGIWRILTWCKDGTI